MVDRITGQIGVLLRIGSVFHLPVPEKGRHPVRMNVTYIFDFYIVLDRVVDTKVDPRCRRKNVITVHNDRNRALREW
jgi:hypothetical protein